MRPTPRPGKVTAAVTYHPSWHINGIKCRLEMGQDRIVVNMKAGAEKVGHPGHGWTFEKTVESLDAGLAFVQHLPDRFGPDDCIRLGFIKTSEVLYD